MKGNGCHVLKSDKSAYSHDLEPLNMRHKVVLTLIFSLFLILISAYGNQLQGQPIKATVIIVNDVGDTFDTTPNDGICADAAGNVPYARPLRNPTQGSARM